MSYSTHLFLNHTWRCTMPKDTGFAVDSNWKWYRKWLYFHTREITISCQILNVRSYTLYPPLLYSIQYITVIGKISIQSILLFVALQWRNNGRGGVSNYQPHHCLLNRLFRRTSKKTSLACVRGIHRWTVNSPHKWPVTRKFFHFMTSSWVCQIYIHALYN